MSFDIKILFENDCCVVFDKPPSLVVNKAESQKDNITLVDIVLEKYSEILQSKDEEFVKRGGIVHRLDKDTSGAIIVAKNSKAFNSLQSQFKERLITKKYTALVFGVIKGIEVGDIFEVSAPIQRNPKVREKFAIVPEGKESTTLIKVVEIIKSSIGLYTLVECEPKTGRTHQIRVHLTALGHPVVGDSIYSGRRRHLKYIANFPRQFLHASYIKFLDPCTDTNIEIMSRLPLDLENMLNSIKVSNNLAPDVQFESEKSN